MAGLPTQGYYTEQRLHSMMSVLPNGGFKGSLGNRHERAALDDVSATEWRSFEIFHRLPQIVRCTR